VGDVRDVVSVKVVDGYRVRLTFDDGSIGEVDLGDLVERGGVFEPLRDPAYFAQVKVDGELGTIVWPNGADLDPCGLYADAFPAHRAEAS
jgi:hypothetical protein